MKEDTKEYAWWKSSFNNYFEDTFDNLDDLIKNAKEHYKDDGKDTSAVITVGIVEHIDLRDLKEYLGNTTIWSLEDYLSDFHTENSDSYIDKNEIHNRICKMIDDLWDDGIVCSYKSKATPIGQYDLVLDTWMG